MTLIKLKLLFLAVLVVSGLWMSWNLHTASQTSTFIRSSDQPADAPLAGTSPKFYRAVTPGVISSKTSDVKVDDTPFKSHRALNKDHAPDVKRSQTPDAQADVTPFKSHRALNKDHAPVVKRSQTPYVKADDTPFKSHRALNKDHAPVVQRSQTPYVRADDTPFKSHRALNKDHPPDVKRSQTPDVRADDTPFKSHRALNKDHAPVVKRSQTPDVKADVSKQDSITLPACPSVPPNLVGFKWIFEDVDKPMKTLEQEWGDILKPGGDYAPPDCLPKDRTAIIIPCRNRWPHLRVLLNHLIPVLIRQQLSFSLFVLDSDQIIHFNKGILLNAGFLEALKYGNYTCFVFQDVDMLTLNDMNLYRCGSHPRHLAVALDRFNFKFPAYGRYVGGALALSKEQVEKVNGYSNAYFGWGREDDDMEYRVRAKGYDIFRMPLSMSQFHTLRHPKDKGNEQTVQSYLMIQKELVIKRMDDDGFRQAVYDIDWVHVSPLFTWIKIMVNETTVIENLPPYIRDIYKNGMIKVHCP